MSNYIFKKQPNKKKKKKKKNIPKKQDLENVDFISAHFS